MRSSATLNSPEISIFVAITHCYFFILGQNSIYTLNIIVIFGCFLYEYRAELAVKADSKTIIPTLDIT